VSEETSDNSSIADAVLGVSMLCGSHNAEVLGRQLNHKMKGRDWAPDWLVGCMKVIQAPAIVMLEASDRHRITEANDHFTRAFKACESPLEEVFLMGLVGIPHTTDFFSILGCSENCVGAWPRTGVEIFQQETLGKHRVDFLFKHDSGRNFVVELDGHAYHSSRAAMQRDKSRDRELQEAGYMVLRFTYDEVWPDPFKSAQDVHRIIESSEARSA
jgi:very-short-patch-repair endonuclease